MAGLDSKEYVKERYEHLKKCYGAGDEYVQGYANCMATMERAEQWNELNSGKRKTKRRK